MKLDFYYVKEHGTHPSTNQSINQSTTEKKMYNKFDQINQSIDHRKEDVQ